VADRAAIPSMAVGPQLLLVGSFTVALVGVLALGLLRHYVARLLGPG
jgi:hypothetical protein